MSNAAQKKAIKNYRARLVQRGLVRSRSWRFVPTAT